MIDYIWSDHLHGDWVLVSCCSVRSVESFCRLSIRTNSMQCTAVIWTRNSLEKLMRFRGQVKCGYNMMWWTKIAMSNAELSLSLSFINYRLLLLFNCLRILNQSQSFGIFIITFVFRSCSHETSYSRISWAKRWCIFGAEKTGENWTN